MLSENQPNPNKENFDLISGEYVPLGNTDGTCPLLNNNGEGRILCIMRKVEEDDPVHYDCTAKGCLNSLLPEPIITE